MAGNQDSWGPALPTRSWLPASPLAPRSPPGPALERGLLGAHLDGRLRLPCFGNRDHREVLGPAWVPGSGAARLFSG